MSIPENHIQVLADIRRERGELPEVLSSGGGLDSFCMLLKAIEKDEPPDVVVFIDVGDPDRRAKLAAGIKPDPGEWRGTYEHLEQVVIPLCQEQSIPFVWIIGQCRYDPPPTGEWETYPVYPLRPRKLGGTSWARVKIISGVDEGKIKHRRIEPGEQYQPKPREEFLKVVDIEPHEGHPSLYDLLRRPPDTPSQPHREPRGIQIYVASESYRTCTNMAKVERFEAWLDDTYPDQKVEVWIGYEKGEEKRVKKDPNAGKAREPKAGQAQRVNRFPLIDWDLCRCRCEQYVRSRGYPVPRKSACMLCPLGSRADWRTLAEEEPDAFQAGVDLEILKPPTKAGKKLTIMGESLKAKPMLRDFITMKDKQKRAQPCGVCGAPQKATKATGCSWLSMGCSGEPM